MTNIALGLVVMSAIVIGVFSFGTLWLKVERRQAKERSRASTFASPDGQKAFVFPEPQGFPTMSGRER